MKYDKKPELEIIVKDRLTFSILSLYLKLPFLSLSQCKHYLKQFKIGAQSIFLFASEVNTTINELKSVLFM